MTSRWLHVSFADRSRCVVLPVLLGLLPTACGSTDEPPRDTTPPSIVSTAPADGAVEVRPDVVVTVNFSEPMDGASLTEESFRLDGPSGHVAGVVAAAGSVANFTPAAPLQAGAYLATVTTAARDVAGNPLVAERMLGFTVRAGVTDQIPPEVLSVSPAGGATDVAPDVLVRATFSEPLDCDTVTSAAFTLAGEAPVQGAVSCEGAGVAFAPTAALDFLTHYEATLRAVADLAGNTLGAPYTWTFQVAPESDTTPPVVVSTLPVAGAIDVAFASPISVLFSEPIDAGTASAQSVLVGDGALAVAGTISVSEATLVFTPAADLRPAQVYTVNLTTGIQDRAGNPLAEALTWSFTTAAASAEPSVLYERYGDLFRVREDGTGRVVIASSAARTETLLGVSASGRIVYRREADLFSVGPEGDDPLPLDSAYPGDLQFRGFTTNDRVLYGMNGDLFAIDPDGTAKATLASSADDEMEAYPAPGGRVVYRTIPPAGLDQKVMSVLDDGTGTVTLDASPQMKHIAHVDAAGRLFYERVLAAYSSYQYDVFRIGLDGSGFAELAATSAFSESFFAEASDGTVALSTCRLPTCDASLFVVGGVTLDCDRGGPRGLTADDRFIVAQGPLGAQDLVAVTTAGQAVPIAADPTSNEVFLATHPDGRVIYRKLVGAQQSDLFSVRSDGTQIVTLAGTSDFETFLGITPTGRVVWMVDLSSGHPSQLWSSNADGTDPRLLRESSNGLSLAGFTKTGKVAFIEALDVVRGADLFLVAHDGTPPVNLTQNPTTGTQSFLASYP